MDRTLTWMALMARPGAGAVLTRREVEESGDVQGAWDAWSTHHPREAASAWEQAEGQWRIVQDLEGQVVTFHDPRYPGLLAQHARGSHRLHRHISCARPRLCWLFQLAGTLAF